jgi:hypothetical protein
MKLYTRNQVDTVCNLIVQDYPTFITFTISFTSILPELSVSYILKAHLKKGKNSYILQKSFKERIIFKSCVFFMLNLQQKGRI